MGGRISGKCMGAKECQCPETTASDVGISVAKLEEALSANHLCTTDTERYGSGHTVQWFGIMRVPVLTQNHYHFIYTSEICTNLPSSGIPATRKNKSL